MQRMENSWTRRIASPLADRGVYWARYTKNGRPICYAVDSRGEVVRRYVVMHDARAEAAVQALWDYLALVDPTPQLRIVREQQLPPTAPLTYVEFDPYNPPPLPWHSHPRSSA
jgi:hypothetical protein